MFEKYMDEHAAFNDFERMLRNHKLDRIIPQGNKGAIRRAEHIFKSRFNQGFEVAHQTFTGMVSHKTSVHPDTVKVLYYMKADITKVYHSGLNQRDLRLRFGTIAHILGLFLGWVEFGLTDSYYDFWHQRSGVMELVHESLIDNLKHLLELERNPSLHFLHKRIWHIYHKHMHGLNDGQHKIFQYLLQQIH